MSNFESSRSCTLQEYEESKRDLITPPEYRLNNVYNLMLAYKSANLLQTAQKLATMIVALESESHNITIVRFASLDDDFNPTNYFTAGFDANGYWHIPEYYNVDTSTKLVEGYFKNYNDDDDEFIKLSSELHLTGIV